MTSSKVAKRPLRIFILAMVVLTVATWNGLRLGEAVFFWKTLEKYDARPLYIAISGGIWMLIGLVLFLGLWLGKTWGWTAALGGISGYNIWYWFDRLVIQTPHTNWSFVLVVNFALLLIILMLMMSHKTRRYSKRDGYERKPQNPTIT
jgi:hypothetical protein